MAQMEIDELTNMRLIVATLQSIDTSDRELHEYIQMAIRRAQLVVRREHKRLAKI